MSTEHRIVSAASELRASNDGDQMVLEGYAARFNSPSKDLGGFRETIAPGAFTRSLAQNDDVFCLFNHSADKVLGRSSSGTLSVNEDARRFEFVLVRVYSERA
jgi:HK97 family phage prohead protease